MPMLASHPPLSEPLERRMQAKRVALLLCCALSWFALGVQAQNPADNYPSRPIRFIVPYTPGSALDVLARDLGQYFLERLGQPMVIEAKSRNGS